MFVNPFGENKAIVDRLPDFGSTLCSTLPYVARVKGFLVTYYVGHYYVNPCYISKQPPSGRL